MAISAQLIVTSGPHAGRSVDLEPGKVVRVGRASRAELSLPDDRSLSGWHFAVACLEEGCQVEDLGSPPGTSLNGTLVKKSAPLADGDRIGAGQSVFAVRIAGMIARPAVASAAAMAAPVPKAAPEPEAPRVDLLEFLRSQAPEFFVLADAAHGEDAYALIQSCSEEHGSLYEGEKGESLAKVAPYLIHLPPNSAELEKLVRAGWGQGWLTFLSCPRKTFADVRRHFRHFLLAKGPDAEQLYFRFYDPRVLRHFLPACSFREVLEFFGPIQHFLVEGRHGREALTVSPAGKNVRSVATPIELAAPAGAAKVG